MTQDLKQKFMKNAIIQILNKIGCLHYWVEWLTVDVDGGYGRKYTIHHFKCNKCGKFTKIKSS